jgi:hypothetical protein
VLNYHFNYGAESMNKIFIFLCTIIITIPCWADGETDKNPPIGTFPTHDFKVGLLFRDNLNNAIVPVNIGYDKIGGIKISSFPQKEVSVYVKVDQKEDQRKEGAILLKYKRLYESKVKRDKRGKITMWIGKGFYKNGNKLNAIPPVTFDYSQYIDYTYKKVDGIRRYLSVAVDSNYEHMLNSQDLKESLEFLNDDDSQKSLLTTCFVHFLDVAGKRWHRVDIPISEAMKGNLKQIRLEAHLILEGKATMIGEYTIEVY